MREVEFLDRWLGQLIRHLKSVGMWENSTVVLWSDHGEEFWEHDGWEHGHTLYNELLHVPLLIHLPGQQRGAVISERVSLLDVAPTLLDLCDLEKAEEMRGRSLAPLLGGTGDLAPMPLMLEGCTYGSIRKAVIDGSLKLVYDAHAERFRLYDLATDPDERHDIYGLATAPDTPDRERHLKEWTERSLMVMGEAAGGDREEISPETLQRLKDMGYIQ